MYATAKEMFFPFLATDAKEAAKPAVKAETAQDERSQLIDKMVETWGTDLSVIRRYFEVSRTI